jgi:hypothetical protein
VKDHEGLLLKAGVKIDPASNVSDAIIEQVLAARSGQLFVPASEASNAGFRNWPLWLQDVVRYVSRKQLASSFGVDFGLFEGLELA